MSNADEIVKKYGPLLDFINRTPEVTSALYDLNLLPEQTMGDDQKWRETTLFVVGYMAGAKVTP